jgi:hypothetical protein
VKYVGQPEGVEDAERLRGVGGLHLVGLGGRPLKYDGSGRREDHDEDQSTTPVWMEAMVRHVLWPTARKSRAISPPLPRLKCKFQARRAV